MYLVDSPPITGVLTAEQVSAHGKTASLWDRLPKGAIFVTTLVAQAQSQIKTHCDTIIEAAGQGSAEAAQASIQAHAAKDSIAAGRYLYPDVPKTAVAVLQQNGIEVYLPEQKCCGMPALLEGDRHLTLEFAQFIVERLSEVIEDGYDIVCSCPTCGYMLKCLLREGAIYSEDYQSSGAGSPTNTGAGPVRKNPGWEIVIGGQR